MKIIVPMAGRGSRLRPHTLTVPKPMVPVAGKPIVHRLVQDISNVLSEKVDEIAFVIGDFGAETEAGLLEIANELGAKGRIYHQEEPLGTAHAVYCAKSLLEGPVVVAFADTLFRADFRITPEDESIIWVKSIDDPSAFGVVKLHDDGSISDFVEKPKDFISDLAMIGVYYFRDGKLLREEIEHLLDNDIMKGGEYQLPDALLRMMEKGTKFKPGQVEEWMDCGNRRVTVQTNRTLLSFESDPESLISENASIEESVVIPPCFIAEGVRIRRSIVGPYASIGKGSRIENSVISDSIVQTDATVQDMVIRGSMIGNHASAKGHAADLSVGDYNELA